MRSRTALLALLLCGVGSRAWSEPTPPVQMAPITARFYFTDRGEWSKNILREKGQFTGWNTGVGEGDAGGSAEDVMIVASFTSPGNEDMAVFLEGPVTITAMAGKKTLGKRVVKNLMIPVNGRGFTALYLTDIACVGRIDVTARYKSIAKTARLNMDCGE